MRMKSNFNRIANVSNRFQGTAKKVLCVCSAGLLRSPTAAVVLAGEPYNYNTRAAGISAEYALIPVDEVLLTWAEEIVCMERDHYDYILDMLEKLKMSREVKVLNIPDRFSYREDALVKMIEQRYNEV